MVSLQVKDDLWIPTAILVRARCRSTSRRPAAEARMVEQARERAKRQRALLLLLTQVPVDDGHESEDDVTAPNRGAPPREDSI